MTTAILVTWISMADTVTNLVTRAQTKYETVTKFFFDHEGAAKRLCDALTKQEQAQPEEDSSASSSSQRAATPHRIKIFIVGHGGLGVDYIGGDADQRMTVEELSEFLQTSLSSINTRENPARVQVVMVSCLFGRSPDGLVHTSPASKLYAALIKKNVFVELISRTEYVKELDDGRCTMAVSDKHETATPEQELKHFHHKQPYTKIRHNFIDNRTVVTAVGYEGGSDVDLGTQPGRKVLWADRTIDELSLLVKTQPNNNATNESLKMVKRIFSDYAEERNPENLYLNLSHILDSLNSMQLNAVRAVLARWPGPKPLRKEASEIELTSLPAAK